MGAIAQSGSPVAEIALLRLLAAGATGVTRAGLARDLYPLVAHHYSPAEWRNALSRLIETAERAGTLTVRRARLRITEAGRKACDDFCGTRLAKGVTWTELRDTVLVGKALGYQSAARKTLKRLESAPGLRLTIVERSLRLRDGSLKTVSAARKALAGNRNEASDSGLVSAVAAAEVGAPAASAAALRLALLRRFIPDPARRAAAKLPPAATDKPAAAPSIERFAEAVRTAARSQAMGTPGYRRAFVSRVIEHLAAVGADWGLDERALKARLAEAHRAGLIQLTSADLRDRTTLADIEASAVTYHNTVWHLIRVEDN